MNRLTGRRAQVPTSLWTIWAWLMVVLGGVSIAAGIVGGVLAPSVFLDIVSFWPLFAMAVLLAAAVLPWRRKSSRISGLFPLLVILVAAVAVTLHLVGWSRLPSAAADLTGPKLGSASAVALSVDLPGRLVVSAGGGALYAVKVDREGGALGVPEALERGGDADPLSVELRESDGGRWFRTNGWSMRLATEPTWELSLASPDLTADLRSLRISSGDFSGAGVVSLGPPVEDVDIVVSGSLTIEVPVGVLVEVSGNATVPSDWQSTADGFRSLGQGPVVSIAVTEGSQAVLQQR